MVRGVSGGCGRGAGCRGCSGRCGEHCNSSRLQSKNFTPDEERQLTRSVLLISQDPVVGNQQKNFACWETIASHYDNCRPNSQKNTMSLETKWGQIKHDVFELIGVVNQVRRLKKSGT